MSKFKVDDRVIRYDTSKGGDCIEGLDNKEVTVIEINGSSLVVRSKHEIVLHERPFRTVLTRLHGY